MTVTSGYVFVVVLSHGLHGVVHAISTTALVVGSVAGAYGVWRLPTSSHRWNWRASLAFSLPMVPHFLAGWLQGAGDRWVLKALSMEDSLGVYVLAAQLALPVNMVTRAWNDAQSPLMGEVYQRDGVAGLWCGMPSTLIGYLSATAVAVATSALALPFLPLLLGTQFEASLRLLPLLWIPACIQAFYFPFTNVVYYAGHTRLIPWVTGGSTVSGLLTCYLLAPAFGAWGAVMANALAMTLQSGGIFIAARWCYRHDRATRDLNVPAEP